VKKWKDILADKNTYPDDFVITTKDGETFNLGAAREYDREHEGELTQRLTAKEQALAKEKLELEKASTGVYEMFNKYLELTGLTAEEALAGKKPLSKRAAAENAELDENDPLVGSMVKEVNKLKAEIKAMGTQMSDAREKILKPMLGTYLDDYYHDRWEDRIAPKLPEKAKDKIKLEDVMKYAEKEGLKDSKGRLNLDRAASEMTSEYRQDEWREQERTKIRKQLEEESLTASMPKPGGGPNSSPRKEVAKNFRDDKGRTKTFDQVLQDAANDADLWSSIAKATA
jgi:hypothetical protein